MTKSPSIEQQFERIKSVETALANGAHYADDDECHPCYPTLVAARQIIEKAWNDRLQALAEPATGGDLREAIDPEAEYMAFKIWAAGWFPDREILPVTSHLFDAWMGSARHRQHALSTAPSNPPAPSDGVRERIHAGLRAWIGNTPDIDLSPRMISDAADYILGQPYGTNPAGEGGVRAETPIYGWVTHGGIVYSGEGYPVPWRKFHIDRHSCASLLLACDPPESALSANGGEAG